MRAPARKPGPPGWRAVSAAPPNFNAAFGNACPERVEGRGSTVDGQRGTRERIENRGWRMGVGYLDFGASLVLGDWCLGFPSSPRYLVGSVHAPGAGIFSGRSCLVFPSPGEYRRWAGP